MKTNKQAAREAKQLFRLCVSKGLLDDFRREGTGGRSQRIDRRIDAQFVVALSTSAVCRFWSSFTNRRKCDSTTR